MSIPQSKTITQSKCNKDALSCKAAFSAILQRAELTPTRILTDNGAEFAGEFEAHCVASGIRISHSRPYQPQSNGMVERANSEVRRRLKSYFIDNNTLRWFDCLPLIAQNINGSHHSAIKTCPQRLWDSRNDVEHNQTTQDALDASEAMTRAKLEKHKEHEFEVGDKVRVLMSSMFSDIRHKIKAGNKKAIVVQYDPTIYKILSVVHPRRNGLGRKQYILSTDDRLDPKVLRIGNKNVDKRFYASELSKADSSKPSHLTVAQALKLDQARRIPDSDVYVFEEGLYFDDL